MSAHEPVRLVDLRPSCARASCSSDNIAQAQPRRLKSHVEPHLGDAYKFWNGELQTLCPDHHDKAKQVEEHRGYSTETGADGWPVDVSHPGNSAKG